MALRVLLIDDETGMTRASTDEDLIRIALETENFKGKNYHRNIVLDAKGDISTYEFYKNYDGTTYSNLMVKETREYTRDATNGLLISRKILLREFYDGEGNVVHSVSNEMKYYDSMSGYKGNKRARGNLIDKASMYLLSSVGEADAKSFLRIVKNEVSGYIGGDIQPLLDAISGSVETYMTTEVKNNLNGILNVTY